MVNRFGVATKNKQVIFMLKKTTFIGGRKTRKAWLGNKIFTGKQCGEGKIFKQKLIFENKKGRQRNIQLIAKEFHNINHGFIYVLPFRNPVKQFKIYNYLKKLNKEKKLNLPILPTFRLEKKLFRKPRLLMTDLTKNGDLICNITCTLISKKGIDTVKNISDLQKQKKELTEKLAENGLSVHGDAWFVQVNPETLVGKLWLADLGQVYKTKDLQ